MTRRNPDIWASGESTPFPNSCLVFVPLGSQVVRGNAIMAQTALGHLEISSCLYMSIMITKNEIIIDGDRHEGSHRILQIDTFEPCQESQI